MRLAPLACVLVPLLACSAATPCSEYGVVAQEGARTHLSTCALVECGNGENPPAAGTHCDYTATCRVHTQAQSRCLWLHNLEHGHVVLAYNCPDGCPEIVDALTRLHAESTLPKRILVTPDPKLPQRVAAMVWGFAYSGDTADLDAIRCVMSQQDVLAPEAGLSCPQ